MICMQTMKHTITQNKQTIQRFLNVISTLQHFASSLFYYPFICKWIERYVIRKIVTLKFGNMHWSNKHIVNGILLILSTTNNTKFHPSSPKIQQYTHFILRKQYNIGTSYPHIQNQNGCIGPWCLILLRTQYIYIYIYTNTHTHTNNTKHIIYTIL